MKKKILLNKSSNLIGGDDINDDDNDNYDDVDYEMNTILDFENNEEYQYTDSNTNLKTNDTCLLKKVSIDQWPILDNSHLSSFPEAIDTYFKNRGYIQKKKQSLRK